MNLLKEPVFQCVPQSRLRLSEHRSTHKDAQRMPVASPRELRGVDDGASGSARPVC